MQRRIDFLSLIFRVVLIVGILATGAVARAVIYTWTSGDITTDTGLNPPTVLVGDRLDIVTGADHDFGGKNLINNGEVRWVNGTLRGGSSLTNNAAWNDLANSSVINAAFSAYSFYNSATGVYTKSNGSTTFNVGFANDGVIAVTGGTLNLAAGGAFTNGSISSSSSGGVLKLTGGLLTITGNVTANNFVFEGGNVNGDHTFSNSVLTWTAGTWNSANTTTIASTSALTINGGGDIDFSGHSIVNNGTINWSAGVLRSGNSGSITNNSTWNDSATASYNSAYGGGAKFINGVNGTYYKIAGTSTFSNSFENYGAVIASGGTLNLAAGGVFYDGSTIGSTGTGVVQLTGGVLTAGGTGGFTATNFLLTSGQLSGNMTFLGTTVWTGSDFNTAGTATVGATGILNISGAGDHNFSGHAMVNNGTVNWSGGALRSGSSGTFTNNATFNDTVSSYTFNAAYGGGAKFINGVAGTYNKTSGTTTFTTPFDNRGTVLVSGGALSLDGGGILYDGSTIGSTGSGVVQLTGGTFTGSGSSGFTSNNLALTGGSISGNLTFLGTVNWTGTNLSGGGTATFGAGSTVNIQSGNDHNFDSSAIVNNGTVNWSAGNIRSGGNGTFTNTGVLNDSANSYAFNAAYGGGATFINAVTGTYNKSSGTTTFNSPFNNRGTVSVAGGTLNLDAGGILYDGSSIGSSGSGVVQLTGGTFTANGTAGFTSNNLILTGGILSGNMAFLGTVNWTGTNLSSGGTTTFGSGSTVNIQSANDHNFNGSAIVNNGTVNWSAGNIRSGGASTFTNNATFNDTANGYAFNAAYGGGATFINVGNYNKTAGTTTYSSPFKNLGTVSVSGGTLNLSNGAIFYDGSTIGSSGSGVVQLTGGTLTTNGTAGFTSNNLDLAGGDVSGGVTFLGTTNWTSTAFDAIGTALFGSGGILNIVSGNDHNFNGRLMVNNGTVNWSAGNLRSGSGGSFTNNGTWVDSANGYSYNAAYGGGATFVNSAAATYTKTAGTTTISVPMTNAGTINVTGGTLAVNSGFTNTTGTVAVSSNAVFSSANPLTFGATSVLKGSGSVTASSVSTAGTLAPGTVGTAGMLTINGDLSLMSTSLAFFELGGIATGTQYDHLTVTGATTLGGTLVINFASGFISSVNSSMTFELISGQSLSGAFSNAPNGSRFATADNLGTFVINYGAGSQFGVNKVVLTDFTAVPEPSTWMLMIAGAGILLFARRRSRA